MIPAFIPDLFWHPRNSTTTSSVVYAKGTGGHGPQTPKLNFYTSLKVFGNC